MEAISEVAFNNIWKEYLENKFTRWKVNRGALIPRMLKGETADKILSYTHNGAFPSHLHGKHDLNFRLRKQGKII